MAEGSGCARFLVLAGGATSLAVAIALAGAHLRFALRAAPLRTVDLRALPQEEVPRRLRPAYYFDFVAHPFAHSEMLTSAHDVVDVLGSIHAYAVAWLERHSVASSGAQRATMPAGTKTVGVEPAVFIADAGAVELVGAGSGCGAGDTIFSPDIIIGPAGDGGPGATHALHICLGAQLLGGTFDLRSGGIWLGEAVVVEPGAHVAGPAIIGRGTTLRCGAYLRGDLVIGDKAVLRGELKNAIVMDRAELAHPGYCGDSIIGHGGHFGCQALTANLGLFGSELSLTLPAEDGCPAVRCRLGRRKVGLVLGDGSQLGCGSVTDPATLIAPRTHAYPLSRLAAGVYGPDEIIKNRVAECGVLVRSPMRT